MRRPRAQVQYGTHAADNAVHEVEEMEAPPKRRGRPRKAAVEEADEPAREIPDHSKLSQLMSKKALFKTAEFWIVGDTPLITHAWSEKAKREMLAKQVGGVRAAREKRDPQADFVSSLYEMGDGKSYGFPVTGLKNAILSSSHKDKGIARSAVMSALYLDAEMVRVRPALAGAICDLPLVRIWGAKPEMREDMVKIGVGLNKTASLAYRAQFFPWAIRVKAQINSDIVTPDALAFLVQECGRSSGLGEWRNEKRGIFGSFHLGDEAEEARWERFAAGRGPLPGLNALKIAAE